MENQSFELDKYYFEKWNQYHFTIIIVVGFIEITLHWIIIVGFITLKFFRSYWTFKLFKLFLDFFRLYNFVLDFYRANMSYVLGELEKLFQSVLPINCIKTSLHWCYSSLYNLLCNHQWDYTTSACFLTTN